MKRTLGFILLFIFSFPAFPFGETGHRITGAIAEKYLTEKNRAVLAELLDNESLAEIATYADEMRSNPDEFWQKTASPYHYVTVPNGKTYRDVGAPPQGDAFFAIEKYSKIFRDPSTSKSDKSLAIKFIVHLIGDLHQPLHVGTGLDRGGNNFKVKFFNRTSNLHSVWDYGMIGRSTLSYTEWTTFLSKQISAQDVKQWTVVDPLVWMQESAEIRATIYPSDIAEPELGYTYLYNHLPTVKLRLKQAGVRIAAYLNYLIDNKADKAS